MAGKIIGDYKEKNFKVADVDLFGPIPRLKSMTKVYEYELPTETQQEILSTMNLDPQCTITFEKVLITITRNDS